MNKTSYSWSGAASSLRAWAWVHVLTSSPGSSDGKESTFNAGALGGEDPLEEGMATHSSVLAWRIPVGRGAWRAAVRRGAQSRTRLSSEAHNHPHSPTRHLGLLLALSSPLSAHMSPTSDRKSLPGVAGAQGPPPKSFWWQQDGGEALEEYVPQGEHEGACGLDPPSAPDCPESTPQMGVFLARPPQAASHPVLFETLGSSGQPGSREPRLRLWK